MNDVTVAESTHTAPQPSAADTPAEELRDETTPQWGRNAPRGAKTVLNRILKEGMQVPMFVGQTLVNSLRDTGYNTTTSAVCEHVDNSIESGAAEIRVFFVESGPKARKTYHVLVLDDGRGMSPNVLKVACAFGGGTRFDNRGAIGRFHMGMKTAALSMGPVMEVYSWQEPGAYYNMTLDVHAIGAERSNVVYLPDPDLVPSLPSEVLNVLNDAADAAGDDSKPFIRDAAELRGRLGPSGTIVFMPDCDRLTYRKAKTLAEHATKEMARVYRRQLDGGLRLYVNGRRIESFDPTYQMSTARHNRLPELADRERSSRLMRSWTIPVSVSEDSNIKHPIKVRLHFLPIDAWGDLPRKVLKNDLQVFDVGGISFMRNDRELDIKHMEGIAGKRSTRDSWWRLEIDFPGELDEAFGVAANKQGVRPKKYVQDGIRKEVLEDLREVRKRIEQYWYERAAKTSETTLSEAEQRANEAEVLQATLLPKPNPVDEQERRVLDENLRTLALALRREGETDEQAYERIRDSTYVTHFRHDEDAPFYRVDFKHGKVILTLNTAHPFHEKLYAPLAALTRRAAGAESAEGDGEVAVDEATVADFARALTTLQLLLLSLGRTQSEMVAADAVGERQRVFDTLRKQWSMNLDHQLAAL